jgi:hypothetical protein
MKWISVKDKLPEKGERVLVTDGKQFCLHYKQSAFNFKGSEGEDLYPIGDLKTTDGKWVECCNITDKITHWMPLPKVKDE